MTLTNTLEHRATLGDPRGHEVVLETNVHTDYKVLSRTVSAECECGWRWEETTTSLGQTSFLISRRQGEVFRHQNQAPERDASGPAIEVRARGHWVKIVSGDHPARPWITHRDWDGERRPSGYSRPNGYHGHLGPRDRIASCSCGAWTHSRDNGNGSAAVNADRWAKKHCMEATRPPRDLKWTRARGWVPRAGETEGMIDDIEVLRHRRDELDRELAMLESLPKEPQFDEGAAYVVFFTKRFGHQYEGATEFTYAAVKAGDGKWYTTGPRTPKGYTWDELIRWINGDGDHPAEVYVGIDWELLK